MQIDRDYIDRFDVINRYNQNKLSAEELNSFEVYILEHPDIINVIEQEKVIHAAFKENESLLKDSGGAGDVGGASAKRSYIPALALAASLLVAVAAVFNYSGNRPEYSLQPPVVLETFRGAGDVAVQASGEPVVQFQIDMGPAELIDENSFNASLVDSSGSPLFSATGLSVDSDGWLFFSLDGQEEALTGVYEVNIAPAGNPDAASTYTVEFSSP